MPEPAPYEAVLSSKASGFLVALSKAKQRQLFRLLFQLASSPNQIGDYSKQDDTGRDVQFILIGDLTIAFWADHAVREFRIVSIEEI
jgi:hypothetical protein